MKICVMGNCQSAPIKTLIQKRINVPCEVVQIKAVHLLKDWDIENVLKIISSSDVVITHLISDNYNNFPIGTNQLKNIMLPNAKLIVVPNAHYIGYFHSFIYIKDAKGRGVTPRVPEYSMFPSDYHDAFCIAAKIKALSKKDLLDFYENYSEARAWLEKYIDESLANLREREQECDVVISDFIEENYKRRQLFWTFNHPTNELLTFITDQIIKKIGCVPSDVRVEKEFLQEAILPVFPFVMKNLEMSFEAKTFAMEGVKDYEQYIEICWQGYEKNPEVVEVNKKNRRVLECLEMLSKFEKDRNIKN
ncbi:hypothetical protein IFR09_20605 [Pseudomonas syringae]|nr:hypothetical protein [Pseudomonas syringae]MBD8802851.1 hypothetical protein [Pseudomonas syringae]MBD8813563.1 hypothetical protein [Pseudomonas syringae]